MRLSGRKQSLFARPWRQRQRVVLLGPHRGDRLPGLGWSSRESAYLAHLIKIAGITFLLIAAFIFTVGSLDPATLGADTPLDPDLARRQTMAAPLGAGFIVSMLLALRVSYGLAATAVDVPFSPRLSWTHSRGNAWTVIGALFLTFFVGAVATTVTTLVAFGVMRAVLGAQEAAAFVDKQFVKLHQSTLRKVDVMANIADRAHRRDLVTLASWWEQNGQSIKRCIEWLKEHWLLSGLSVTITVVGLILKILKFL